MRRFVLAGLLGLLCAGLASAWFMLTDRDAEESHGTGTAKGNAAPEESGNPPDLSGSDAKWILPEKRGRPLDSPTSAENTNGLNPVGEAPRGGTPENSRAPDSSADEIGEGTPSAPPPPGAPNPPSQPDVIPSSARDPTIRERVTRDRYSHGKLPSARDIPRAVEGEKPPLDLSKLAEPDIWAEYWAREGYTPPAMIKTPVRGKVMSLLTNMQVPFVKVRIFTFFPATSRLNGPMLPVIMETVTDARGFFEIGIPVPEAWPSDYPRYALGIEEEGKRLMDCAPYDNLRAGERNEIGVFWAPEEPYEVEISVTTAETGLTVATTGRIDPRRWETARAARIFEDLPQTQVGTAVAKLAGTWDFLKPDNLPYLTLLRSGKPVLTRQCVIHPDEKARIALDTESFALFFGDTPLDKVLSRIRTESGLSISHTAAVDGDSRLNLGVGRTTLRQALDLVADQLDIVWRIESGGIVFDEAAGSNAPDQQHPPFLPTVFPNDGALTLGGTVVDAEGTAIHGAVLTLTVNGEDIIAYSNSTGWFEFHGLPGKTLAVAATHDQYVGRNVELQAGTLDAKIVLPFLRPHVTLNVVDDASDQPITELWIDGTEVTSPYALSPKGGPLPSRHMQSSTGSYLFEHDKRVTFLIIQAPGFKAHTLEWVDEQGVIDIRLAHGLDLQRRPRDYDAAQTPNLFKTDDGDGPGLWSLDDDHWVEYAFDFGEDEQNFDLILGVTNHTYATLPLDNEYLFEVRVWVGGKDRGIMKIASDPNVAQLGRISLRKLAGAHTVRIMWLNDRYIPGQLDANIRYESIRILQVP